jgi:hypothetical protein
MAYILNLSGLTPREAITDALYRAVIGFDRNDIAAFDSAFVEDVLVMAGPGVSLNSRSLMREHMYVGSALCPNPEKC